MPPASARAKAPRPPPAAGISALRAQAESMGFVFDDEAAASAACQSSSAEVLDLLDQIADNNRTISQLKLECDDREFESKTKAHTRSTELDEKKEMLATLADHLDLVYEHRKDLTARLQQPFVGDFLPIEAQYQGDFKDLLQSASQSIAARQQESSEEWLPSADLLNEAVSSRLQELSKQLAALERYHSAFRSVRETAKALETAEAKLEQRRPA